MRKQSLTETISFKLTEAEKKGFTEYCDKRGLSISEGLRELIVDTIELTPDRVDLLSLLKRVEALEAKIEGQNKTTQAKIEKIKPKDDQEYGELITIQEAVELTGYAKSSLSPKFSREGIKAIERIEGNRGGLYSKEEILQKIGRK